MDGPKGWSAKVDGRKSYWLEKEDLTFDFHSQWGHVPNEHLLEELVKYYGLPSVSLRNVLFHAMKANRSFHGLRLQQLYYDRIHPSDAGHSVLASAIAHLVKHAALLDLAAGSREDACGVAEDPLPPPMQRRLVDDSQPRVQCYYAKALAGLVSSTRCDGWALRDERSSSGVSKPGYIATRAGAACSFEYRVASSSRRHRIGVGYLKSYRQMGRVRIECSGRCSCEQTLIDAHHSLAFSPYDLRYFSVSLRNDSSAIGAAAMCTLRLTVSNETSSGAHKFKLTALFINQQGERDLFGRWIMNQAIAARQRPRGQEARVSRRSSRRARGRSSPRDTQ